MPLCPDQENFDVWAVSDLGERKPSKCNFPFKRLGKYFSKVRSKFLRCIRFQCINYYFSVLKSIAKRINAMQVAKEMEFSYMTAACQILLGPGRVGHPTVVQEIVS